MQGRMGTKDGAAYSASKWGILGLMKSAALELGAYNITVNAILPGLVGTALTYNEQRFRAAIAQSNRSSPAYPTAQEAWNARAPTMLLSSWLAAAGRHFACRCLPRVRRGGTCDWSRVRRDRGRRRQGQLTSEVRLHRIARPTSASAHFAASGIGNSGSVSADLIGFRRLLQYGVLSRPLDQRYERVADDNKRNQEPNSPAPRHHDNRATY